MHLLLLDWTTDTLTTTLFSLEGSSVTLSYKYSKQATVQDYFFWYRQYPGKPPEFLISHIGTGQQTSDPVSGLSYEISEDKTEMDLQISSAAVTDSAVYYCAVRPTLLEAFFPHSSTQLFTSTRGPHYQVGGALLRSLCSTILSIITAAVKRTILRLNVEHQPVSPLDLNLVVDMEHWLFHAEIIEKSIPLKIQKLQLSDSAVYYCALRPTVTGNTTTLYKNLWSKDNTIFHNIH
uniref:Ig-like domain-containing protein n=1 Tax=Lates calcarifer TaxID=8187 RepID=A0A4W6C8H9_LATCA